MATRECKLMATKDYKTRETANNTSKVMFRSTTTLSTTNNPNHMNSIHLKYLLKLMFKVLVP